MRPEIDRVECAGRAILFATGPWARLPEDIRSASRWRRSTCAARPRSSRARPSRVSACSSWARARLAPSCAPWPGSASPGAARWWLPTAPPRRSAWVAALGACDRTLLLDATDATGALARVEEGGGALFDLVVNCASVPGTEMAADPVHEGGRDGGLLLHGDQLHGRRPRGRRRRQGRAPRHRQRLRSRARRAHARTPSPPPPAARILRGALRALEIDVAP